MNPQLSRKEKKENIYEEINKGIDYSNGNRVWKAIGDLLDLERLDERIRAEIEYKTQEAKDDELWAVGMGKAVEFKEKEMKDIFLNRIRKRIDYLESQATTENTKAIEELEELECEVKQ
jgi:hypothetical protein